MQLTSEKSERKTCIVCTRRKRNHAKDVEQEPMRLDGQKMWVKKADQVSSMKRGTLKNWEINYHRLRCSEFDSNGARIFFPSFLDENYDF